MYRIRDAATGGLIEEVVSPIWLKQQRLIDWPIGCDSLDDADGLYLSDDTTMVGIKGRGMGNYTPLVTVEEISGEPYMFAQLNAMQSQIDSIRAHQTETTVPKSDLDTAYKEGVNSYGE